MPAPNRDAMLRLRASWKDAGLCSRCGHRPAASDGTRCEACRFADKLYRVYGIAGSTLVSGSASSHTVTQ